jgi:hypothetical protein
MLNDFEPELDVVEDVFALAVEPKGSDARMFGHLYCPGCGERRRMSVVDLDRGPTLPAGGPISAASIQRARDAVLRGATLPFLLQYTCLQCGCEFTAVLDRVGDTKRITVLPRRDGGMTTPHTPPSVAYYLSQAYLSHVLGAHSAAVAMYRAAVEHLLFEQGYTVRTLGPKITALEADRAGGKGPAWLRDLDPTYLRVLNELGNAAIHPGDGDIAKQAALDAQLVRSVEATILELLDTVYELPHKQQSRLLSLQSVAQGFKK